MTPILAAVYARGSTEHQQYSIPNQLQVIHDTARQRGMEIVRTYLDPARSGLTLAGRAGLQAVLSDVRSGRAAYSVLLVYDVSRWGRFQNTDEAAFYEFTCQLAGVRVVYCAEEFEGYGAMMAALGKSMKRAMAGEYSRELSGKSWRGCSNLVRQGFKMGGPAGFGLRRMLLDEFSRPKHLLEVGQRKSLQGERVVLVPGPRMEVEVVWRIFDLYAHTGLCMREIADLLNLGAVPPETGLKWNTKWVRGVLDSPKYMGDYVWNRRSAKLGAMQTLNPPEEWIRSEGSVRPLVTRELFERAQRKLHAAGRPKYTRTGLKNMLQELLSKRQHLSAGLIVQEYGLAPTTFAVYFGSLRKAYEAAGYCPLLRQDWKRNREDVGEIRDRLVGEIVERLGGAGRVARTGTEPGLISIEGRARVYVQVLRSHFNRRRGYCWYVTFPRNLVCDQVLLAGLDRDNRSVRSFFLVPYSMKESVPDHLSFRARTIERYRSLSIRSGDTVLELCSLLN